MSELARHADLLADIEICGCFSGRPVAQDPNDEPAVFLFERIRA